MYLVQDAREVAAQVQNSSLSRKNDLAAYLDDLFNISTRFSNLIDQVSKATNGHGFNQFDDDYNNGPTEQKDIENLRQELDNSKNNLADALRATITFGPKLSLTNVNLTDNAYQQNSRIIRGPEDQDFSTITLRDVNQAGRSTIMNSSMNTKEFNDTLAEQNKRHRISELADLLKIESLPEKMKEDIFKTIKEL
ncbi:hypothetical protein O1611_g5349 [Lasiodiplodia mahajangana]|uniref:Uncharacterized protein n=1 Tax=Lasiodiplodia mahajangana TaxID=1108764 RepID=A0ACC2JLJ1_9PEZI|nr:hypothetical protein O1611_g5349 [Lasiodiplodia mahajangana]